MKVRELIAELGILDETLEVFIEHDRGLLPCNCALSFTEHGRSAAVLTWDDEEHSLFRLNLLSAQSGEIGGTALP